MAYIWINPVVAFMYEEEVLNAFLCKHGHKRLHTTGDWITVVKEKYQMVIQQSNLPVMDMRCPKIKDLLEEIGITFSVKIPEIKPILIHCAKEGSRQKALEGEQKIITTPCQALADMGNALALKDTVFLTWNDFVSSIGEEPERIPPKESPIPPGFFEGLGVKTASVTGEEEIRDYLKNGVPKEVEIVELLFCKNGCHNGDGIRK